jgi:hypothetical protein
MTFEFFRLSFFNAISDTWRGQLRCSFATEVVVFESFLAPVVAPGFTVPYAPWVFRIWEDLSGKFRAAVLSGLLFAH